MMQNLVLILFVFLKTSSKVYLHYHYSMYVTTTMYVIMCILKKTKEAYATKSNKINFLRSVVNFLKRKGKNKIFLGQLFGDLKNL